MRSLPPSISKVSTTRANCHAPGERPQRNQLITSPCQSEHRRGRGRIAEVGLELTGRARNHHVEQALVHADRDLGHLRQNELALDAKALVSASKGLIDKNFKLAVDVKTAILAAAGAGKLTPVGVSAAHNGATIATLLNDLRGGQCALPNECSHPDSRR
jgi:hypothetical protein